MAEETTNNLAGRRVSVTFRGLLHFPHSIDPNLAKQIVYDGQGTPTAMVLGGENTGLDVIGDLGVTNTTILSGNLSSYGDIGLIGGGMINDVMILSSGSKVSARTYNNLEVGGTLRIREQETNDYELIFGDPTASNHPNIFTFRVKNDASRNLYIKHRYVDKDILAPLWINWSTGEVNIRSLRVNKIVTVPEPDTSYPPDRDPDPRRNTVPIGCIVMFPSLSIPPGWHECNGQVLSKVTYPELWEIIQYTYGGSLDSYRVPDLRGLFVRGLDRKRADEAQNIYDINKKDPDAGRNVGSVQDDGIKSHVHFVKNISNESCTRSDFFAGIGFGGPVVNAPTDPRDVVEARGGINSDAFGITETRPKNIALVYCIKW
jgi:hypothetical protein